MTFAFKPAVRENVGVLVALAGASGSGKTFSALRLARGIAGPQGKVAVIDTEARRALHYAGRFDFLHGEMGPPFRPGRFLEAIRAAESAGADVVVIDSFSHEYDGTGGLIDWADEQMREGKKSPANWMDPKKAHKRLMDALLQMRASVIFCLRADEKIEIVPDPTKPGRTMVRPLGWMPICEKRFMYEMTASFTLTPDRPGVPRLDYPHKLQEQHRPMFPADQPIGEDAGAALRAWANGGEAPRVIKKAASPAQIAAASKRADEFRAKLDAAADAATVTALLNDDAVRTMRDWLTANAEEVSDTLEAAIEAASIKFQEAA